MTKFKLTDIVKVANVKVRINPETIEETGVTNRDGVAYYRAQLVEPIMVRMSTKPSEAPIECTEIHFLAPLMQEGEWQFEEDAKGQPIKENGVFLSKDGKEYVADFSINQMFAVYQHEYIQQWIRNNRKHEGETRNIERVSVLAKLREKQNAAKIKPVDA